MAKFNIYNKYIGLSEPKYIAVKKGYSFPGFFFTFIWAFVKKLWLFSFILVGIIIVFTILTTLFFDETTGDNIARLLNMALAGYVGYKGNDIFGKVLIKRGYVLVGLYEGNKKQAIDKAKNKMPVAIG